MLSAVLALTLPGSAQAKGFTRAVLIGADGQSVEVWAKESVIDGLLSARSAHARPGRLPAPVLRRARRLPSQNPARYYPEPECSALDWPTYEWWCGRISATLVRVLAPARALPRFTVRPTVLATISFPAGSPAGSLQPTPFETRSRWPSTEGAATRLRRAGAMPLAAAGEDPPPLSGRATPSSAPRGLYANGRLHPLRRGVWEWFRLNVD